MNIFVIMPFDSEFDKVYQDLIKQPLEEKGHYVNRADDIITHQNILKGIIKNISNADLIIADLTAQNANVYYELGIAHSLSIPTIPIVQNSKDVPFDLRQNYVKSYSVHFSEAKQLTQHIIDIVDRKANHQYQFSNPVAEAIGGALENRISILPVTSTPFNNTAEPSDGDEDADVDLAPGLLDSLVLAEDSIGKVGQVLRTLTADSEVLLERISEYANRFEELRSKPNQRGVNSQKLQTARKFAADLNKYSEAVEAMLPIFSAAWTDIDLGTGHALTAIRIKDDSEIGEIVEFIVITSDLRSKLTGNVDAIEEFRVAQRSLRGLSKATDRALTNSDKVMRKLLDEYSLGLSVLTRIIELAQDMIHRFRGDDI